MDDLLNHRTFLDAKLILDEYLFYDWLMVIAGGIALGLIVARVYWFRSAKQIEELKTENARLRKETGEIVVKPDLVPAPVNRGTTAGRDKVVFDKKLTEKEIVPDSELEVVDGPVPARDEIIVEEIHFEDPGATPFGTGDDGGNIDDFSSGKRRVVYIMDVSQSLDESQFEACKKALNEALVQLPETAMYQVIFFSGAAWFANHRMVEGGAPGEHVVIRDEQGDKHKWSYAFGGHQYEKGNEHIPAGDWRNASLENREKTLADVEAVDLSYGTTWHLPFMMAMNLEPVPTHIYFLTDGKTAHQDLIAEGIVDLVKRRGNRTKITTTALKVRDAAEPLKFIARETGGKYSLIA